MEQEGVIKYSLKFRQRALKLSHEKLAKLNSCRTRLMASGLLGQDDKRYEGYGFGNISIRHTIESAEFYITGSQTGSIAELESENIALVTQVDSEQNSLWAAGQAKPSSEAMTHGVLYQVSKNIQAVVHVHSPDIWRDYKQLNLASTSADIPYGTPAMAMAVTQLAAPLFRNLNQNILSEDEWAVVFVMKGHEDGVVAAGTSLEQCTKSLLDYQQTAKLNNRFI